MTAPAGIVLDGLVRIPVTRPMMRAIGALGFGLWPYGLKKRSKRQRRKDRR